MLLRNLRTIRTHFPLVRRLVSEYCEAGSPKGQQQRPETGRRRIAECHRPVDRSPMQGDQLWTAARQRRSIGIQCNSGRAARCYLWGRWRPTSGNESRNRQMQAIGSLEAGKSKAISTTTGRDSKETMTSHQCIERWTSATNLRLMPLIRVRIRFDCGAVKLDRRCIYAESGIAESFHHSVSLILLPSYGLDPEGFFRRLSRQDSRKPRYSWSTMSACDRFRFPPSILHSLHGIEGAPVTSDIQGLQRGSSVSDKSRGGFSLVPAPALSTDGPCCEKSARVSLYCHVYFQNGRR